MDCFKGPEDLINFVDKVFREKDRKYIIACLLDDIANVLPTLLSDKDEEEIIELIKISAALCQIVNMLKFIEHRAKIKDLSPFDMECHILKKVS